jgi:thioesterase domain-containing protein
MLGMDDSVELILLIDSHNYHGSEADPPQYRLTPGQMIEGFLRSNTSKDAFENFQRIAKDKNTRTMLKLAADLKLFPAGTDIEALQRQIEVRIALGAASVNYVPHPVSATTVLFKAESENAGKDDNGWQPIQQDNLCVVEIGGTHFTIMQTPQIERLGREISKRLNEPQTQIFHPESAYSAVQIIQRGMPNSIPVICIPGAGANVTCFFELSLALGGSQSVAAMQARGLDGVQAPYLGVTEMASAYAKEILSCTPEVPRYLVGHSFGGLVAFEIALQLEEAGLKRCEIILLDTEAPRSTSVPRRRFTRTETLLKLIRVLESSFSISIGLTEDELRNISAESQLNLLLSSLIQHRVLPKSIDKAYLRGIIRVFESNINDKYVPSRKYFGKIHVVTAVDTQISHEEQKNEGSTEVKSTAFWTDYAPHAHFYESSGDHFSMLRKEHISPILNLIMKF